ncbi:MAG: hypothetical protein CL693_00975 [Cellvibrionaceae bacterium]|nr:hypothetical protein [Cellvibrionaceae bacterium]
MQQRKQNTLLRLSDTKLPLSVQRQLLKLQLDIEIVTKRQFNISKNASVVHDLLAFASVVPNQRLSRSYELLIDSLRTSEKRYLKEVLNCRWLVVIDSPSTQEDKVILQGSIA